MKLLFAVHLLLSFTVLRAHASSEDHQLELLTVTGCDEEEELRHACGIYHRAVRWELMRRRSFDSLQRTSGD